MSDQLNRLRAEAAAQRAAAQKPVRPFGIPRRSPTASVAGTEEDFLDDAFSIVSKQSIGEKSIESARTRKSIEVLSVHSAKSHESLEPLRGESEKIQYASLENLVDSDGTKIPIYRVEDNKLKLDTQAE